ncbi:MAG: DUF2815 family protein [Acidiferrobacterales bacterium]|nr:DUF2815 family protein [Acidiferrobacterales bacterium]
MSKIKIASARLSFPSLFQMAEFNGESTGKYEATFVLDKVEHADLISDIKAKIDTMMKEAFKGKIPSDKICLKDGDELGRPEFEGKMTIKASTKKRPLVINRDKSPITEDDNVIYAGCYVNGIVNLWAQSNSYGRRINASLDGVQFARDGEPFGTGGIDADEFDDFEEF